MVTIFIRGVNHTNLVINFKYQAIWTILSHKKLILHLSCFCSTPTVHDEGFKLLEHIHERRAWVLSRDTLLGCPLRKENIYFMSQPILPKPIVSEGCSSSKHDGGGFSGTKSGICVKALFFYTEIVWKGCSSIGFRHPIWMGKQKPKIMNIL